MPLRGYLDPGSLPLPTLLSAVYRLRRYHTARAGDRVEYIGFKGLSCEGCTDALKRERGCHLPGYSYRSLNVWRVDYHDPVTAADRVEFCPNSLLVLASDAVEVVNGALDIIDAGGLKPFSDIAPANLPQWYKGAYDLVVAARSRAEQEADNQALAMQTQKRRELELLNKMNGMGQG